VTTFGWNFFTILAVWNNQVRKHMHNGIYHGWILDDDPEEISFEEIKGKGLDDIV